MKSEPTLVRPLVVDEREAAKLLGISVGTLKGLRRRGEIAFVPLSQRRIGYRQSDLVAFVDANVVNGNRTGGEHK